MSYTDVEIPRCPKCGDRDEAERVEGSTRMNPQYFCGRCDHVYTGSPSEWQAEAKARIERAGGGDVSTGNQP